jgi:adenylate kinase family enzyme
LCRFKPRPGDCDQAHQRSWECTQNSTRLQSIQQEAARATCDLDGAPLRQRPDDTPEAAAKRIDLFYQQTAPLLDYYRARKLVREINADQSIEQVTQALLAAVEAARRA